MARGAMRTLRLLVLAIVTACSGSGGGNIFPDAPAKPPDAAQPPDPVGHYSLNLTWSGGNCPSTPAYNDTFSVTMGANGYVFTPETAQTLTGGVSFAGGKCTLFLIEDWDNPVQELRTTVVLAADGTLAGNSTLTVSSNSAVPAGCTETASVTGMRQH